ncbi:MAG: hypothetical protein NTY74_10740 [Ignavibacteriae bacterium]|nr:hypothetical protein [Ignavibacteriota bacterium]
MQNYKNLFFGSQKYFTFVLVLMLAMPVVLSAQSFSSNMGSMPVDKAQSQTGIELIQKNSNPLNPTTCVDFRIPSDSKVSMKICDANNVEVFTLLEDELTAGFHSVQFYVPGISGNGYYYNLTAESGGLKTVIREPMHFTE